MTREFSRSASRTGSFRQRIHPPPSRLETSSLDHLRGPPIHLTRIAPFAKAHERQRAYDFDLTCLVCNAPAETRRTRILTRRRHPAHAAADQQQLHEADSEVDYTAFPGRLVHIDIDQPLNNILRTAIAHIE